jgi:hypothetical protein
VKTSNLTHPLFFELYFEKKKEKEKRNTLPKLQRSSNSSNKVLQDLVVTQLKINDQPFIQSVGSNKTTSGPHFGPA